MVERSSARVSTRRSEDHWSRGRGCGHGDWNTEYGNSQSDRNKTGMEYEVLAFSHVTCELSHDFEEQNGKEILRFLRDWIAVQVIFIKIRHTYKHTLRFYEFLLTSFEKWKKKILERRLGNKNRNISLIPTSPKTLTNISFYRYTTDFSLILSDSLKILNLF